jgi:uncharacterized protein
MLKIIFLIVVLFIFITLYSFKRKIDDVLDSLFPQRNVKHQNKNSNLEELVKCANCGTYIPKSSAIKKIRIKGDDLYFCSKECKAEYKK